MLIVFPPNVVADTKIIFGYNFLAPLKRSASLENFPIMLPFTSTVRIV